MPRHVTEILAAGTHDQIKTLVEAQIAKVTIAGTDRPVVRAPLPALVASIQPLHQQKQLNK